MVSEIMKQFEICFPKSKAELINHLLSIEDIDIYQNEPHDIDAYTDDHEIVAHYTMENGNAFEISLNSGNVNYWLEYALFNEEGDLLWDDDMINGIIDGEVICFTVDDTETYKFIVKII